MFDVSMPYRVMQDVVRRRPKVTFRFHFRFGRVEPSLTAAFVIFTIPSKGRATVQQPQFLQQIFDSPSVNQNVIMVW